MLVSPVKPAAAPVEASGLGGQSHAERSRVLLRRRHLAILTHQRVLDKQKALKHLPAVEPELRRGA